jgi:uncharacterized protein YggT (Ycf19 family)
LDVVLYIITALLAIYALLIVLRAVLSWLRLRRRNSVRRVEDMAVRLTDPYLRVFRAILPVSRFGWPARRDFGSVLGFVVLFVAIQVLIRI